MQLVLQFIVQTVRAIKALQEADCFPQALIVLYSAIDTLAWLSAAGEDVTRTDFCSWVDRYMLPDSPLMCQANELYAARCSLLHTHTAESKLSRSGQARQIWYYGAGGSRDVLLAHIGDRADVVPVRVVELVEAFAEGAQRFVEAVAADPVLQGRVSTRVQRWLRFSETKADRGPSV